MAEENKEDINKLKLYNDYENMTDFLNDYIISYGLDAYYRGVLQSEEALLPNAVKNRHKLKILKGYLDEVESNQNSKFVGKVFGFIDIKSNVFVLLDKVCIAFHLLNQAKTQANEEKRTLEVQIDAIEQIVIANTNVDSKQKEKGKIEENLKTIDGIKYSDINKTESYPKQNIKDNEEQVKHNKSKIYKNESQSTKQGTSNNVLNVNVTDVIKLIDDKYINNRLKNTVEEKLTFTIEKICSKLKSSKSSKELRSDIKEFLNLKLDKFANNHEGDKIASEIIEREKIDVLLESVKPSKNTTKSSSEENNSIKSEVSNQDIQIHFRHLNSKIIGYELKQSYLEKLFKFYKKFELIFSFPYCYTLSEEVVEKIEKTRDKHIQEINKVILELSYVNDAGNISKDVIRSIFLVQTSATFYPNVFTGNIQKVQKVSSFAVSKTNDKSKPDDTIQLYSKTGKFIDEANKLFKQLNKNISFKIDTDGKKLFTVGDQDFKASESKQAIFNCEDEMVKISFIDSQIFVSTENSEFHISIRKPKYVDIQDDCTQTENRQ